MPIKQTSLGPIDTDYSCVMHDNQPARTLKAKKWTLDIVGTHVEVPSRHLFITESGKVYVVMNRKGKTADYASLDSLIETIKKTTILEGFSG